MHRRSSHTQLNVSCSLTPKGLMAVMGVLAGLSLFIALGFWVVGAVCILPFSMLEVFVLAAAFICHARTLTQRRG